MVRVMAPLKNRPWRRTDSEQIDTACQPGSEI